MMKPLLISVALVAAVLFAMSLKEKTDVAIESKLRAMAAESLVSVDEEKLREMAATYVQPQVVIHVEEPIKGTPPSPDRFVNKPVEGKPPVPGVAVNDPVAGKPPSPGVAVVAPIDVAPPEPIIVGPDSSQVAVEKEPSTYNEAYEKSVRTKRPLMLFLTAEWCPHCKRMLKDVMVPMRTAGKLKDVVFYVLDLDVEPDVGKKLQEGGSIPRTIIFHRGKRHVITGYQPESMVVELIGKALK
jgi:thiol-disulfide isomerase/thioredoxin